MFDDGSVSTRDPESAPALSSISDPSMCSMDFARGLQCKAREASVKWHGAVDQIMAEVEVECDHAATLSATEVSINLHTLACKFCPMAPELKQQVEDSPSVFGPDVDPVKVELMKSPGKRLGSLMKNPGKTTLIGSGCDRVCSHRASAIIEKLVNTELWPDIEARLRRMGFTADHSDLYFYNYCGGNLRLVWQATEENPQQ
eukprot:UN0946